jgi:hypothetical protein
VRLKRTILKRNLINRSKPHPVQARASEELVSFRCYPAGILASKYEPNRSVLEQVKAILKRILTKRINVLQPTGVDEHCVYPVGFFLKDIEELTCGGAIEIADKL